MPFDINDKWANRIDLLKHRYIKTGSYLKDFSSVDESTKYDGLFGIIPKQWSGLATSL